MNKRVTVILNLMFLNSLKILISNETQKMFKTISCNDTKILKPPTFFNRTTSFSCRGSRRKEYCWNHGVAIL